MPRAAIANDRMSLRLQASEKATILRASALAKTDMTDFVMRSVLKAAHELIDDAERIRLSRRDGLRVLALLENPPKPNAKLRAAARALPRRL
jgi:uncharacterized protein (DUF1778 family)